MAKMLTQDELQYLEHCNKLIRETRESLIETERITKDALDQFIPALTDYVNGMRAIQHDFLIVARDMLKSSKELQFLASNHRELTAYTEALRKLGETFNTKEVQDVIEIIKGRISHD